MDAVLVMRMALPKLVFGVAVGLVSGDSGTALGILLVLFKMLVAIFFVEGHGDIIAQQRCLLRGGAEGR